MSVLFEKVILKKHGITNLKKTKFVSGIGCIDMFKKGKSMMIIPNITYSNTLPTYVKLII